MVHPVISLSCFQPSYPMSKEYEVDGFQMTTQTPMTTVVSGCDLNLSMKQKKVPSALTEHRRTSECSIEGDEPLEVVTHFTYGGNNMEYEITRLWFVQVAETTSTTVQVDWTLSRCKEKKEYQRSR